MKQAWEQAGAGHRAWRRACTQAAVSDSEQDTGTERKDNAGSGLTADSPVSGQRRGDRPSMQHKKEHIAQGKKSCHAVCLCARRMRLAEVVKRFHT